jgi:ribosomal protein S12 methylthiotransferase accessory factor
MRPGRARPIVFLGPSLAHDLAREILDADYRFPIRRGDINDIAAGSVVAIIDGVFDEQLAVTPTELRNALARGVRIFGASSMGALRAVEVPGVVGVGRIYEMYRDGKIDSDDEVAITFDPESLRPLCEPLVNVRYAVDRLAVPGTLSREMAARILRAAKALPYFERVYSRILARAGLAERQEVGHLAKMLASHDLKREDAITLLEQLRGLAAVPSVVPMANDVPAVRARGRPRVHSPVHFWEFGPPLSFRELLCFLALTGTLRGYALRAATRLASAGTSRSAPDISDGPSLQALYDRRLAQTARAWQWATPEEADTSLSDLGIAQETLKAALLRELANEKNVMAMVRRASPRFLQALRIELFLDDLALKREAARAMSLRWLADRGAKEGHSPSATESSGATRTLCRQLDIRDFAQALEQLAWWGVKAQEVHAFVAQLALARRARFDVAPLPGAGKWRWLRRSPKANGSRRFCMSTSEAHAVIKRLRLVVGVTRVAMITGLGTIGIPNAQAFRPDGEWSSTVGSGKSESVLGARIGAVMEEVEKWAQEQYSRRAGGETARVATFDSLCRRGEVVVDPRTLDLPYDSCYSPDLAIPWVKGLDLASGTPCLLAAAAVMHTRVRHDIYYSPRGGRKAFSTNGLASGMTLAEAVTHALCEYIERDARALDTIVNGNPGAPLVRRLPNIALTSVPESTRRLMRKIVRAGYRLVVRSIVRDVRVPVFVATILLPEGSIEGRLFGDGWQQANGWAAHPDPETAINMAILEASQTIMSHVAGAREDLTLAARSLGRHERTDSRRRAAFAPEFDADAPRVAFTEVKGFVSADAATDVRWIVNRLQQAGFRQVLMVDYSTPEIAPARVVRVLVPGLETINPFHTGLRARGALVADLLAATQQLPD